MKRKRKIQSTSPQIRAAGSNGINWLTVVGAAHNNLKNIDVPIPLGRFVCVTGVSGSGKSSLVNDIIHQRLSRDLNGAEKVHPGKHKTILGLEHLDKVIDIDQTPIGRTPRSNPATYIKVFDEIRKLYSQTPDARVRGYKPGRFSFNVHTGAKGGGRCEACEGNGANKMEMDFLADVWMPCPICNSHRFNRETLQIRFKDRSISDVLEMDVQEALEHFENVPKIADMLQTLHDVGLDYMKLGQSSTTLSGGEAQRIKLARELVKRSTGRTLYLLDEPTTGLHFADIKRLLTVLHGFVDAGNTVVVIEHNTDVIKTADWIIDLGPEGGEAGGYIVAQGAPEKVAKTGTSETGKVLSRILNQRPAAAPSATKTRKRAKKGEIKEITVVGAQQHNLKNLTVSIPREKTTICSGLSGSGKSSLAIDTVYAEGQRRYVESLSSYARQFVGQLQKPKVEHVQGLSPAISIEQKAPSRSPRSTVGTVTEIYDYLRILWARLGTPYCPTCKIPIGTQSSEEIIDKVMSMDEETRVHILAPIQRSGSETYAAMFEREKLNGYWRVRVDGSIYDLDSDIPVDHRKRHDVELVVDRAIIKQSSRSRIADSIEQALAAGSGVMILEKLHQNGKSKSEKSTDFRFSQLFACDRCGTSYDELTPHHFSFNTRLGWCSSCEGLGVQKGASPAAIVTHPTSSVLDGAIGAWGKVPANSLLHKLIVALADSIGFDPSKPWNDLTESQRLSFLQGGDSEWIEVPGKTNGLRVKWRGFFPAIDRATRSSWQYRKRLEELVTEVPCQACRGSRLRPESREVRLGGLTLAELCNLPLRKALAFLTTELKLNAAQKKIAGELLQESVSRLTFLVDVGLDYLTLSRSAPTLSGGESQRIRLASQIGSGLTGVLYVLDEPTIGLHPRDNDRLISALHKLQKLGNTLLIVEHDRDVIASADHVLDFGPGAGSFGGKITAAASPAKLKTRKTSLTGQYLSGKKAIAVPSNRRAVRETGKNITPEKWLTIHNAYHNNLKEIDVSFPLGRFTCVTGVSGSGKSSLITEILYKSLAARIHRARLVAGGHDRISGTEHVDKVINVDQSPIGNSPTSNPATYTGVFDLVRELFARLPDSKIRGYTANRFSFNRPGGRCEACEGNGQRCIEMHFLPDVWVDCENCHGTRYTADTLQIKFKGKSIADVLEMRISEALELFSGIPKLRRMLGTLDEVGLGYLKLGQAAPTLSGGEAQRVKLAAELGRPSTGKTLYILDEPTTGLHFEDLAKLLKVLHRLVDLGNTVICIEHNLDIIKNADWILELGPEAGNTGGELVASCTPEELTESKNSHTGKALIPIIQAGPLAERPVFNPVAHAQREAELTKEIALGEGETETRMPWQIDGRKWHLSSQLDREGRPTRWDPAVLEWVVDTIESLGSRHPVGFAPTDWANPARVEIKAPGTQNRWLLHALTRGSMLIDVTLRVPTGSVNGEQLARKLGLGSLDEREDLPIYGRDSRVQVRRIDDLRDNVRILLHDQKDLNKKEFKAFLKKAVSDYFKHLEHIKATPDTSEPWKTDPRNWHLNQGSLKSRKKTIRWKPAFLLEVIGLLKKYCPEITIDWKAKVMIRLKINGQSAGAVVTANPDGLKLYFKTPENSVTPTQVDKLGTDLEIERNKKGDGILFMARSMSSIDKSQFQSLVKQMAKQAQAAKKRGEK